MVGTELNGTSIVLIVKLKHRAVGGNFAFGVMENYVMLPLPNALN